MSKNRQNRKQIKIQLFILSLILPFLLSCASSPDKKQAEIYVNALESMASEGSEEVASKITEGWSFECFRIWGKEDPAFDDIAQENEGKTAFTKKEAGKIFSQKGKFKVMHFMKYLRTEKVSIRTISSTGYTMVKDVGKARDVQHHAYIRVVFRDDKLVHFRVWPCLETQMSPA
jgi:hypothetical protein